MRSVQISNARLTSLQKSLKQKLQREMTIDISNNFAFPNRNNRNIPQECSHIKEPSL